jgi:hypothetical protein
VRLDSASGGFVSYAQLPVMRPHAEVMTWGHRLFVATDTTVVLPDGQRVRVYREGMMCAAMDPRPHGQPLRMQPAPEPEPPPLAA